MQNLWLHTPLSFVLGQQDLPERESAPEITGARVSGGVLLLNGESSQIGLSIVSCLIDTK